MVFRSRDCRSACRRCQEAHDRAASKKFLGFRQALAATLDTDVEQALRSAGRPAVTDYFSERPSLSRPYCPGCEPDADVLREILEVSWCEAHQPLRSGIDDALAAVHVTGFGSAEAGGEDNRRWCEMLHAPARRRRRRRRKPVVDTVSGVLPSPATDQ